MDRVDSSGSELDLDFDLESGGTSDEDPSKDHVLNGENSKNVIGRMRCSTIKAEVTHGSTCSSDCSCSYENLLKSNEISSRNREMLHGKFRDDMNFVDKTMDKEKCKKQNFTKPPKPPRPPRGPSMDSSDVKFLKELFEINLKRKKMERIRTLKKMKKENGTWSSLTSNLFALLVTIIFLLVIFMQGCATSLYFLLLHDRRLYQA